MKSQSLGQVFLIPRAINQERVCFDYAFEQIKDISDIA